MSVSALPASLAFTSKGLLTALLVLAAAPLGALSNSQVSQTPGSTPTATAAITGAVIDGTTKDPIPGAVVHLSRGREPVGPQSRQLTDGKGRFAFTNLPAGENYTLTASRFGYFDGAYGRAAESNAPGALLTLTDGQWVSDARIALWRPASVGGTVTDESGEPIVNVHVRAIAQRRVAGQSHLVAAAATMTDDRGRYRIGGLRPGRFYVSVPTIQWSVPSTMTPAAIAGMNEQLAATREVPVDTALDLAAATRLVLGNFPVPPPAMDGRRMTYPIVFHPGAAAVADATAIELKYGEDRDNVDIRLDPVPAVRVAGKVQGPPEAPANLTLRLVPGGLEELGQGSEAATTIVSADGSFMFVNVSSGSYVIDVVRGSSELVERAGSTAADLNRQTFPPRPPGQMGSGWSSDTMPSGPAGISYMTRSSAAGPNALTGRASLVVSGQDVLDVTVQLRPAAKITGSMVFEQDPQKNVPRPQFVSLRAEPANGDPRLGLPRSDSRPDSAGDEFEIPGLQPGRYLLRANVATPWLVRSVTANGKDVTHTPLVATGGQDFSEVVVRLTTAGAIVRGTATDAQGQAISGAAVLLFPAEPSGWTDFGLWPTRIKTISASNTGTFQLPAVPAGDYYAIALPREQIDAWQAPDFFKQAAPRAMRFAIGWGETKTVDLRVDGGR